MPGVAAAVIRLGAREDDEAVFRTERRPVDAQDLALFAAPPRGAAERGREGRGVAKFEGGKGARLLQTAPSSFSCLRVM